MDRGYALIVLHPLAIRNSIVSINFSMVCPGIA
jgi:hypothetical protein